VLHLADRRQFDAMTLELDGDAHLSTGVLPTYVRVPATHAARWVRSAHVIDQHPGLL
jgi:hypothetical protein